MRLTPIAVKEAGGAFSLAEQRLGQSVIVNASKSGANEAQGLLGSSFSNSLTGNVHAEKSGVLIGVGSGAEGVVSSAIDSLPQMLSSDSGSGTNANIAAPVATLAQGAQ